MASDLIIRFLGDTTQFNAKLAETEGKLGEFSGKADTAGQSVASKFGLVSIAAIGAIAVASLKLADQFDVVHTRLETVTKAVGENFDDFKGKVQQTDDKMANLGFSAIDVEGSLTSLTAATHDVSKATALEGTAADLARFKHESLAAATQTLVAIEAGRLRGLAALGISTKDVTGKTIDVATALQRVADVTKGQAIGYTHTLAGEFDVLKANLTNAGIALGEKLMPYLNGFISGITKGVTGFEAFNAATGGLAGKILAIGAAAPFAIAAFAKLASVAVSLGAAFVAAAEDVYLFVLLNPELLAFVGIAAGIAAVGAAFFDLSGKAHLAQTAIADLTNAELDKNIQDMVATINTLNENRPVGGKLDATAEALSNFDDILKTSIPQAQRYIDALARAGINTDAERSALAKKILAQKEADAAQKEATGNTQSGTAATAAAAAAAKTHAAAMKTLTTSLDKYGDEAGPLAEKIASSYHLTAAQVDNLTQTTKTFNDGIDKAFSAASDTVDAWEQKSSFSLSQFESDLLKDTIAQANWSRNIAILSDTAINRGFLQTLIDAGPKSATVLQGLVDGVNKGSVKAINAITNYGTHAATTAKQTVDAQILGLHGSFADLAAYINGLHPNLDIRIAGQSATPTQIHNLATAQRAGGASGLGFADGGYVPGPKGAPVPAIVHGGEYVVSNEEQARGRIGNRTFASVGTGRGAVINLEVNINATGDGAEIGRQLVASLQNGAGKRELKKALDLV